jgi:peptide deformylase
MRRIRSHIVFTLCLALSAPAHAGFVEGTESFRCGVLYLALSQAFWPKRGDLSRHANPTRLALSHASDPILRRVAAEVPPDQISTPWMQELFDDMLYTMRRSGGIGLAAPQVGESLRVAVIMGPRGPLIIVNPRLTVIDEKIVAGSEGCLSLPGINRSVNRYRGVRVEYLDRNGQARVLDLADLPARIAQHENDHLDGILITGR